MYLHFVFYCFRGKSAILLVLGLFCISQKAFTQNNDIISAWTGTVDQNSLTVNNLPVNGRVIQLKSSLTVSDGSNFLILDGSGKIATDTAVLTSAFSIEVTAQNGDKKTYSIQANGTSMPIESVSEITSTVSVISNKILKISGNASYHVTNAVNPLQGSILELISDNIWLYFDNIKPSIFNKKYITHILVNGVPAVANGNVRLVQYLGGCVLISQSSNFQPLKVFSEAGLKGTSLDLGLYTYHKSAQLGALNDNIASFILKKGYMATFAENEDGTGASKVYIAADSNLQIMRLPSEFQHKISLVRVFPWRWVAKKGWTNTVERADSLKACWTYDWNNDRESSLDAEYVPIRQTQWWPGFEITNVKTNVTHLLGYNEPDKSDQANLTVDQAISGWPGLMESGLRLGSPAVSDGGLNWLYSFMDKADAMGYRVDFVAVHFYRGCQSAAQFYSFLKGIHDRTHRPIWITEFNNGANWTNNSGCPKPSYQQQANTIGEFLNMLDTTSFVERYALYEWVEDTRQMFKTTNENDMALTPAGIVYRDKTPAMAYNPAASYDPYPVGNEQPFTPGNLAVVRFGDPAVVQSGANPIFIDEYNTKGEKIQTIPLPVSNRGSNFSIVSSSRSSANSDGLLTLSPDGKFISVLGYNTTVGSVYTNSVSAASTPRSVAVLDVSGSVNTSSSFNDVVSSNVTRGVVVNDGGLYMTGGSAGGIRYGRMGAGTVGPSSTILTTPGGTRKVGIYGGDIYFSQYSDGLSRMFKIPGTPVLSTSPVALTGIPIASAGSVSTGFVLFDVLKNVNGYDLLYYVDETPTPAIQKYVFNGTTWIHKGTFAISGLLDNVIRDITGTLENGVPTLYGVSFTSVAKLEDKAVKDTGVINITKSVIINDPIFFTNAALRGISFVPGTSVVSVYYVDTDPGSDPGQGTNPGGDPGTDPTGVVEVSIYPNPSSDEIKVRAGKIEPGAQLLLYDSKGGLIKKLDFVTNPQTIDVRSLAGGIYFLQIRNGKNVLVKKIMRQ